MYDQQKNNCLNDISLLRKDVFQDSNYNLTLHRVLISMASTNTKCASGNDTFSGQRPGQLCQQPNSDDSRDQSHTSKLHREMQLPHPKNKVRYWRGQPRPQQKRIRFPVLRHNIQSCIKRCNFRTQNTSGNMDLHQLLIRRAFRPKGVRDPKC